MPRNKDEDHLHCSKEYVRKLLEVIVEAKRGLPGFNVLAFQFIPFKTATWLLLAAYVPTQGDEEH